MDGAAGFLVPIFISLKEPAQCSVTRVLLGEEIDAIPDGIARACIG